jgi:prolyl-tRNA synthetase
MIRHDPNQVPWVSSAGHPDLPRPAEETTVILRMSRLFLRTLREDPVDAEVPSHRLLVRAGYVRRVAPGIFSWLPLGYRVFRNVEQIIREEMDRFGAQEVHFPALLPREPYEASGRWTTYGEGIFRLQDRKGGDYLLGPTHEELFTLLVKDLYSSYKDLPLSLYQIQTKYRDEARPRAGLLRGREFVMKDSYSFDVDDAGLQRSYDQHREAYIRAFDRLGLDYVIVSAMSGAMGGNVSEEFLAPCEFGEDTFVRSAGGYAANVEAVRTPVPDLVPYDDVPAAHVEDTPDTPTIETLVALANERFPRSDRPWTAADTLKNVVVTLRQPDGTREALVVGVPGDRDVDIKRLEAAVTPAEPEAFTEADFASHPMLVRGYIGPAAFDGDEPSQYLGAEATAKVRYLLDPRVVEGTRWVTGANAEGRHVFDLVAGRDFTADGTIEAAEVRAGDPAPDGSGPVELARGIEIGHIFQLGRWFAEALDLKVLDENGRLVTVTMGSYGIGVSRAVAAVAEQTHDDAGLCWPREVAPADVHLVAAGRNDAVFDAAERLASSLEEAGVRVLYDDRRGVSPGVKFNDSELLGVPTIVVVGHGLASGTVEVKDRRTGERIDVPLDDAVAHLVELVRT